MLIIMKGLLKSLEQNNEESCLGEYETQQTHGKQERQMEAYNAVKMDGRTGSEGRIVKIPTTSKSKE